MFFKKRSDYVGQKNCLSLNSEQNCLHLNFETIFDNDIKDLKLITRKYFTIKNNNIKGINFFYLLLFNVLPYQ